MTELLQAATRPAFANYIGGEWQPSLSGDTYDKRSPAQPSDPIGVFPASSQADVDAAVAAADAAFPAWAAAPAAERAGILRKAAAAIEARAEQIAQDMSLEMGKPLREARMEAARAAQVFQFFASEGWRPQGELFEQSASGNALYTRRRPLGVVALITPWNFPAAVPSWKAAAALIYGNTVVMKLSQEAPLSGLHLAACLEEAGIPPSVLNIVIGRGGEVGTPLVSHPETKAISFTGSVAVGEQILAEAARGPKRVQLELGGQNPLVVLADADLDRAVEAAYAGAYWSAGQKCTATRRIYAQQAVYEEFRSRLLARMARGVVGDPSDPDTEVGPLVSEKALQEVLDGIARGRAEGGTVIVGGERLDDDAHLLAPTLFEGVADEGFLSCEEVFGPVASLYPFAQLDEAIKRANAVRYGLSASIFTRDANAVQRFVEGVEAGMVHVNQQTAGADVHVPFGGVKASAYGPHEQGRAAIEFYTDIVTVYQDF